jgi:hypothetical protein
VTGPESEERKILRTKALPQSMRVSCRSSCKSVSTLA